MNVNEWLRERLEPNCVSVSIDMLKILLVDYKQSQPTPDVEALVRAAKEMLEPTFNYGGELIADILERRRDNLRAALREYERK